MKILVGLPSSGKTTYALNNRGKETVIVSRDDIRLANYGVLYGSPIDENFVTKVQRQQIIGALENGFSIIVADTNLNRSNVQRIVDLAAQFAVPVEYIYFEKPVQTLIDYDKNRGPRSVGERVIRKMAKKAGINKHGAIPRHTYYYHEIRPYVNDLEKQDAIIVDIDGTIALKSDRSPYDYSRVYEDSVRHDIVEVIEGWKETQYHEDDPSNIIFLSGRSEDCREQTLKWLKDKLGIWWESSEYHLFMRPSDDPSTADFIVKDRLFDEYVNGKFNVIGVFDDRRQVVQMWRTKGLTVFDVAGNKF